MISVLDGVTHHTVDKKIIVLGNDLSQNFMT